MDTLQLMSAEGKWAKEGLLGKWEYKSWVKGEPEGGEIDRK